MSEEPVSLSASDLGQVTPLVYHLEDDPLDARLIAAQLAEGELDLDLVWVQSAEELYRKLDQVRADLILLDFRLRGETGLEVMEALAQRSAPPTIVLSGEIGEEHGVECLQAGAVDYVLKDRPARLVPAIKRALAVAREQVRLRELEALLRQRERLESLGLLASGIAHDFNNILGGILNLTEAAAGSLPPEHPAREFLHQTQRVGSRAASLTRRLLAFSRNQPLEPKKVDFNAMVEETVELFARLSPPEVEIRLELCQEGPWVKVDPGQLQHVILNLGLNARDSMPKGGLLQLRTTRETISAGEVLPGGSYARLDVVDTGCGIAPDQLELVFSPFFTTKGEGGTGLGLASALGTISQSGGDLRVTSKLGHGSTFSLLLPEVARASIRKTTGTYDRTHLFSSEGHGVLLVEDDDLVRDLARDYLRDLGYQVETAATGAEAIATLESKTESLDALIADVVMPDLSGREVVKIARDRHPDCKVVYTSGYSRDSVLEGNLLEEDEVFLQKPVRLATLASILKKSLS